MPAQVIDSRPPGVSLRYGHWPLASWQAIQCFSAAAQYASGTSMPTSAPDQTPSNPYCELELSQMKGPPYFSGSSCGGYRGGRKAGGYRRGKPGGPSSRPVLGSCMPSANSSGNGARGADKSSIA